MTRLDRMIAIREAQGLSVTSLSALMGYDRTYLNKIEKGLKPLNDSVVQRFKDALNMPMLPLTKEEEIDFIKSLHSWKDSIIFGETDVAKKLQPQLARCVELIQCPSLQITYDLISTIYYRSVGETERLDDVLASLSKRENSFTKEQAYRYTRQLAVRELSAWHYRDALKYFLDAEKTGDALNLNNEGFYYNIAHCLTDMGYASKAIEYLEKAQKKATEKRSNTYSVYIRDFIALNYSSMGRHHEALEILESCLRDEKQKANKAITIGSLYRSISMVHFKMSNNKNALKNIDIALSYCKIGSKEYIPCLYHKAVILIADKEVSEAMTYLSKVINMSQKGTIEHVLTTSLKHYLSITCDDSLNYIETFTLPQLHGYGKYLVLSDYYEILSGYYKNKNKSKALHYSSLANELIKKLSKGDLDLWKNESALLC